MLYWERTVSQCQNNWEPRAHISFVGAGLHFLMENILANTTCGTIYLCNSNRKKNNGMITYNLLYCYFVCWCHESSSIRKITSFCNKNQKPERDFLMLRCHQTLRLTRKQEAESKMVNIFLSQHLVFLLKIFQFSISNQVKFTVEMRSLLCLARQDIVGIKPRHPGIRKW